MKTLFTTADFQALGTCAPGLARVEAFGGVIENTPAGWAAYIAAYPEAWTAPVWTAQALHRDGAIHCPDLIWKIARIAFREQPETNAGLRMRADTLGAKNWRAAADAAYTAAADAAYTAAADAAYTAAADAAYTATAAAAYTATADAAYTAAAAAYTAAAAAYTAAAAADADAAAAAAAAARASGKDVKPEIIALAVEALRHASPTR